MHGNSPLASQLLQPPVWRSPNEGAYDRIMTTLLNRVQGPNPSYKVRKARLELWRRQAAGVADEVVRVSGPLRQRVPTDQETGQHVIQQSDGILWCSVCGLYTRKRQSRQFAAACTGVARPTVTALRDGRHPTRRFAFRETTDVCAEVFALPAHSYRCRLRQYAQQLLFGYDAARCDCWPGETLVRPDNPLSLP